MDIHQTDSYTKFIESIGWIVERTNKTNIFVRKLGPTAVIKIQRPENLNLTEIEKITRKYNPLLVKIEPGHNSELKLQNSGFQKDAWPLIPTKTIILDLNPLKLENLPKDTRYEIRKAQEKSLSFSSSNDIGLFYELLQETMKIGGWSIPIRKEVTNLYQSFQPNNSVLLFTNEGGNPLAACLLIWQGETAHYIYAALTKRGREVGAAYFLLWETIRFLQKKNIKFLDLEGIYDQRYPQTQKWRGFTKFKMGWNGRMVDHPGSFTKYAHPLLGWLFKVVS